MNNLGFTWGLGDEPEYSIENQNKHEEVLKVLRYPDINLLERVAELEDLVKIQQEQIKILTEALGNKTEYKSIDEGRINAIKNKLYSQPRRFGYIFLSSIEIRHFLEFEIEEDLRLNKVKNPSDSTIKIMKKVRAKFPDEVILEKGEFSHRKLTLRLKI